MSAALNPPSDAAAGPAEALLHGPILRTLLRLAAPNTLATTTMVPYGSTCAVAMRLDRWGAAR